MKKWFFGIIFSLLALVSCNEDMLDPTGGLDMTLKSTTTVLLADGTNLEACGTETVTLWAGQTIDAGTVVISNDVTNLYVTINSTAGFQQVTDNIKMWLGTDLTLLNGGGVDRPAGGKLPYKVTVTNEKSYTFTIPLQNIRGYNAETCGQQTIYVVVHGDVLAPDGNGGTTAETAFGGDVNGKGSAWWFYNEYKPACCLSLPPTPDKNLETAFAYGTHVFVSPIKDKRGNDTYKNNPDHLKYLNLTQNRWGWANYTPITGTGPFVCPVTTHKLQLLNDMSTTWGNVNVTNDENNLYIEFTSIATGWFLKNYNPGNGIHISYNNSNTTVRANSTTTPFTVAIPLNTFNGFVLGQPITINQMGAVFTNSSGLIAETRAHNLTINTYIPTVSNIELPIYAGAGLNNTANGTLVGKAIVSYDGAIVKVKYVMDAGYEMEEVHIYASDTEPLTIAPGQYGFTEYFDPMVSEFETEFDVPDTNGDGKIWIILHAVVNL